MRAQALCTRDSKLVSQDGAEWYTSSTCSRAGVACKLASPAHRPRRDDGMGLAAPQVGLNLRLMVFNVEGVRGKGKELVLVNPIIMSSGKALWTEEEACLSFRTGRTAVVGSVTVWP